MICPHCGENTDEPRISAGHYRIMKKLGREGMHLRRMGSTCFFVDENLPNPVAVYENIFLVEQLLRWKLLYSERRHTGFELRLTPAGERAVWEQKRKENTNDN
jgi:hypothetical protein